MLKRLVPVAGDMTQPGLGLEEDIANVIIKEVDIIVSSAANTTFDERFCVI
jgi:thioester reductase-like protein